MRNPWERVSAAAVLNVVLELKVLVFVHRDYTSRQGYERGRSRGCSRDRSPDRSRAKSRGRSKSRPRSHSRSPGRSRGRSKSRPRSRSRSRSRGRSYSRAVSRGRSKSRQRSRSRSISTSSSSSSSRSGRHNGEEKSRKEFRELETARRRKELEEMLSLPPKSILKRRGESSESASVRVHSQSPSCWQQLEWAEPVDRCHEMFCSHSVAFLRVSERRLCQSSGKLQNVSGG